MMLLARPFTAAAGAAGAIVQARTPQVQSSLVNVTTVTFGGYTLPAGDYLLAFYYNGSAIQGVLNTLPTVDGNATSELRATGSGSHGISTCRITLASAITAADIVATPNSATNDYTQMICDVYEVVGGFTTFGSDDAAPATFVTTLAGSINITSGQTAVGIGARSGSGGFTWTGAEDEKVTDDSSGDMYFSLAYQEGLATETPRSVSWSCGTSETRNLIVAFAFTP